MDQSNNRDSIIIAVIGILVVSQAYLYYRVLTPIHTQGVQSTIVSGMQNSQSVEDKVAAAQSQAFDITIVGKAVATRYGTVASVSPNQLTLTSSDGSSVHIVIAADTSVVQQGKRKDPLTIAKDSKTYMDEINTLQQNAAQNQDALRHLVPAPPFIEIPSSLSALVPGQTVTVQGSTGADGTLVATKIYIIK